MAAQSDLPAAMESSVCEAPGVPRHRPLAAMALVACRHGDVCQPQGLLRETSKPAAEVGFTQSVSLGCGTRASGHGKVKAGVLDIPVGITAVRQGVDECDLELGRLGLPHSSWVQWRGRA